MRLGCLLDDGLAVSLDHLWPKGLKELRVFGSHDEHRIVAKTNLALFQDKVHHRCGGLSHIGLKLHLIL